MSWVARAERRLHRLQARILRSVAPPIEPLAFLHVPKSAGTAFTYAIQGALLPGRIVAGFDRSTFGGFDAFATVPARTRARIFLSPAEIPPETEFLAGHFAKSTLDEAMPNARQMMLLREPGARILSQWAYWRGLPASKYREWGGWADRLKLAKLPLEEFLAAPRAACQTDNVYLRALLWPHALIPDSGFILPESDAMLLKAALTELASISFTGVLEDPALRQALEGFLGHRLKLRRVNVTGRPDKARQSRPLGHSITRAQGLVAERSRLDRVLWRTVAARVMSEQALENVEKAAFDQYSKPQATPVPA